MKIFIALLIAIPLSINAQEDAASDILFLKIQELEGEIANLRSEIESQAYLIEKLLNEGPILDDEISLNIEQSSVENTFRFEGINDSESIVEVYDQAISDLNSKDYQAAKKSFTFLANNFDDDEKIPLSLFWLGEISLLESNLDEGEEFFQRLIANYPNHWNFRTLYLGNYLNPENLPWHYFFIWFSSTTPILFLITIICGLIIF